MRSARTLGWAAQAEALRAGQIVCESGHSDQIARIIVSRAIQPSSASVRSASPTIRIAAVRSPQLTAHASAALPNSRHSWRARAAP